MNLEDHPTVKKYRQLKKAPQQDVIDYGWLKELMLKCGADDTGFVEVAREGIKTDLEDILRAYPAVKSVISYVCRVNRLHFNSADRSLADVEFVAIESEMERISRKVIKELAAKGIGAVVPSENFPMDMLKWPGKMWTVSHKQVAVAAGMGHLGHHRLLIHPTFGNYICLGTILIDTAVNKYNQPLEFNPCIECKLCVSVCPTGAVAKDGSFDFFACLTHAYRDRLGGFINWVEDLVSSKDMTDYRKKRDDSESMAIWQSLTHGGGFRCGYCMSVCPAGEDVIGSYIDRMKDYVKEVVKPLKEKAEPVYVMAGTGGETSVPKRFPKKTVKKV